MKYEVYSLYSASTESEDIQMHKYAANIYEAIIIRDTHVKSIYKILIGRKLKNEKTKQLYDTLIKEYDHGYTSFHSHIISRGKKGMVKIHDISFDALN